MPVNKIIQHNIELLSELKASVFSLNEDQYQKVDKPIFTSSVGAHVRHALEHYLQLLAGLDADGWIDYDLRKRDIRIERDQQYAGLMILEIQNRCQQLIDQQLQHQHIKVYHCTSLDQQQTAEQKQSDFVESTLHRELLFLHSHTIHHQALIMIILRHLNIPVDRDFGVAPSTQLYQKQKSALVG